MTMNYPTKTPGEVLDYRLDLRDWLGQASGDTVARIVVTTAPPGLRIVHAPAPEPQPTVWLTGGDSQTEYVVTWRVETNGGRVKCEAVSLVVA